MAIPHVLHACWFGGAPKPAEALRAVETWHTVLQDWEIREWSESNLALPKNAYVRWCKEAKQWAFLSDYARAYVLNEFGGVYVDYDVAVKRPLDVFLTHRAFSGFESGGFPFTAVWGSEAGHPWPQAALAYLDDTDPDRQMLRTNTTWTTDLLVNEFGINPNIDTFQLGKHGIAIYPSETFCVESAVSWAVHEFAGSWLNPSQRTYKHFLQRQWESGAFLSVYEGQLLSDLGDLVVWMLNRRGQAAELSKMLGREPFPRNTAVASRSARLAVRRILRMYGAGLLRRPYTARNTASAAAEPR